jgi:hypothetical protein
MNSKQRITENSQSADSKNKGKKLKIDFLQISGRKAKKRAKKNTNALEKRVCNWWRHETSSSV